MVKLRGEGMKKSAKDQRLRDMAKALNALYDAEVRYEALVDVLSARTNNSTITVRHILSSLHSGKALFFAGEEPGGMI